MRKDPNWDGDLHMWKEKPRVSDYRQLAFLRALAEANALEHPIAGDPTGPALELVPENSMLDALSRARCSVVLYTLGDVLDRNIFEDSGQIRPSN